MRISVSTEMKDREKEKPGIGGWILFDGQCALCRRSVESWRGVMERRGFEFAPLQAAWVRERLGPDEAELWSEMRVLLRDGQIFGGGDAIVELARRVWWARPLVWLAQMPGARRLLRRAYREVAARRLCESGASAVWPHGPRMEN
jgi:predicted DCC family thiol-disulfide oxidoreductase YuxK